MIKNDRINDKILDNNSNISNELTVVVSAFGSELRIYKSALLNSIKKIYPNSKILFIGDEIITDIDKINNLKSKISYVRKSPGSLKIICWNQGMKLASSKYVLFIDLDTILLKDLSKYLNKLKNEDIDIIFSWRKNNTQWVNTGVLIVKKSSKTIDLFDEYEHKMLQDIQNNHNDQYTFLNFLNKNVDLSDKPRDYEVEINSNGINYLGISGDYINNNSSLVPWSENIYILHLKGIMSTIILKNSKDNRYNNFIRNNINCLSKDEVSNLSYRINLFKNFSEDSSANEIIDVMQFYKGNKFFYCFLRKIYQYFVKKYKYFTNKY